MKQKLIVIGLALLYTMATGKADEFLIGAGVGVFNSGKRSLSESKLAKFGVQEDVWGILKQRINAGAWLDNAGGGRTNSGFGGYQLGFEAKNNVLEMSIFTGPALITSPDVYLGGIVQFNETLFLGIVDKDGSSVGAAYEHFSSAGIETPNIGRDFFGLEVKLPLN